MLRAQSFRPLTPEEREAVMILVGQDSWAVRPSQCFYGTIPTPYGDNRHGVTMDDAGNVTLYLSDRLTVIAHEFGHAIHAMKYPQSFEWPAWKAEAFAMMAEARMMKHKRYFSPAYRAEFARHIRMSRKQGSPDHKAGFKLAFRAVFKHFYKKDQEAHVVNATQAED